MAERSLLSENANLLETTAKVKYVREEVTKKLEQYREQYEEMHIRALSAELEVSNLLMKFDEVNRELQSRQDFIKTLVDQMSNEKSQQSVTIEVAKQSLSKIRAKLKAEFEKMQNNQKDLRVGVNSFMRCIFEFRTGVISQNDFLCATDLIFSSLEANDRSMTLSPSPTVKGSYVDVMFNNDSLRELASLPPEQRRKKLERIIDQLSPELLLCPSSDDILSSVFEDSISSPSTQSSPPIPSRQVPSKTTSKSITKQSMSESGKNLPPPLPPRPILHKPKLKRGNTLSGPNIINGKHDDSDSESDFEKVEEIRKIRYSNRISSEPSIPKYSVQPKETNVTFVSHDHLKVPHNERPKKLQPIAQVKSRKPSLNRSRSCDLLRIESPDCSDSSDGSGYAFPFEHIESWRKLVGLRDSSVLTGSLPRLHGMEEEQEYLCYITPNEFRSIVSRVRGESVKMGHRTSQRVIDRVDSFIKSRQRSSFGDKSEYLSLLGENGGTWLRRMKDNKKQTAAKLMPKKIKPQQRLNYENQGIPVLPRKPPSSISIAIPQGKVPNTRTPGKKVNEPLSPIVSSPEKTFDDPKYDTSVYSSEVYIKSLTNSPTQRHPSHHKIVPVRKGSPDPSTANNKGPVLPPKPHLVDIKLRSRASEPLLLKSNEDENKPKPTPKPRTKISKHDGKKSKEDLSVKTFKTELMDKEEYNHPLRSPVPAYFTLKRGTHSLRLVPQICNTSDSDSDTNKDEEDPGSYSLGRFEFVMNSELYHTKPSVSSVTCPIPSQHQKTDSSVSSDSDSDDYVIPPDASFGYVEPVQHDPSVPPDSSRDRKYTTTLPGASGNSILCEKQGYLHKLDPRLKHWTRRWFVLKGKELKYFSKKTPNCRAKGVINLAAWCKITRHEMTSSFQLATPTRTYHFVADSNADCEEWIKVLQTVMRMCQTNLSSSSTKDLPAGWAKVKLPILSHVPQKMWITLVDQSLIVYQDPNAQPMQTFLLVDAMIRHSVDVPDQRGRSSSTLFSSQVKEEFTIVVEMGGAGNERGGGVSDGDDWMSISLSNKDEKDLWYYHLVSASCGETGPELTLTEKLVARLWRTERDGVTTSSALWCNPVLNYTKEMIHEPLISLPSAALGTEAVQMFKTVHLFITTQFDPLCLDYHIHSVQQLANKCLTQPELRDELYCQMLRQISGPPNLENYCILQSWYLLSLLLPHFLPRRKLFQWYLQTFLTRMRSTMGSLQTAVAQLANLCEQRLTRVEKNGLREKKPSWFELHSLMSRPIHITCLMQLKIKLPVHLLNDSSLDIECDSITTVQEFISHINQEIGMHDTHSTGFALMSDWPGEEDIDVFYLFPNSKLFDVISMWSDSLVEMGNATSSHSRLIRLTYRNRLSFRERRGQESDKEALLLAYQKSKDVLSEYYPVNTVDLALDIAARMAQIDYGDCDGIPNPNLMAKDAVRRFCPMKFTKNILPHDMSVLGDRLLHKWMGYHGSSRHKCARGLLNLFAEMWDLFGSTLFYCRDQYSTLTSQKNSSVWLAVHEDGISFLHTSNMKLLISYSYKEIATFGGHGDDFMLVINARQQVVSPSVQTEKIILSMPKLKIREATYLMASYLDS